ncbi:hypothetical protein JW933_01600 [candidate division FCPU426 bacterium]|nr:hypothetical protein [candidate division FCPU426 bacterium]
MGRKIRIKSTGEGKQFLLGLGVFFGLYLISYVFVLFITPIPSALAGRYALITFTVGVLASIVLIFTRHSVMGLGGSLAAILYVVFFAVTWPIFR